LADDEDDDEVVVETDAPDDAETDVKILFDFFNDTPVSDDDGHSGFSRHSSGLSDEKSARIPLSVCVCVLIEKVNTGCNMTCAL
jgi:hypothetical protein